LTTSHGFFISCDGKPSGTVGISVGETARPLRRTPAAGVSEWPFDTEDCVWKSRKSCAPFLWIY
jgi:hypothetical protein